MLADQVVRVGALALFCVSSAVCASNGVFFRGTRSAARSRNKKQNREKGSEQERRKKRGQGQGPEEGERLHYNSTHLVNFAFNFSLYVRSTDLRAVSMTCDLHTEQRKRDSGKKYERREEQRIRAKT
jgi:hypothetical protein